MGGGGGGGGSAPEVDNSAQDRSTKSYNNDAQIARLKAQYLADKSARSKDIYGIQSQLTNADFASIDLARQKGLELQNRAQAATRGGDASPLIAAGKVEENAAAQRDYLAKIDEMLAKPYSYSYRPETVGDASFDAEQRAKQAQLDQYIANDQSGFKSITSTFKSDLEKRRADRLKPQDAAKALAQSAGQEASGNFLPELPDPNAKIKAATKAGVPTSPLTPKKPISNSIIQSNMVGSNEGFLGQSNML